MVAGDAAGSRVSTERRRRESILPSPLLRCVRILPSQGFRKVNLPNPGFEITSMALPMETEVGLQTRFQGAGQGDDSVFAALAVVDGDGSLPKIEILDSEAQGFHLAKASSVDHFAHQFPGIFQFIEDGADFLVGKNRGRSTPSVASWSESEVQIFDSVNGLAQEGQSVESLPLSRRGNPAFQGEEFQVSAGRTGIESIQVRFPEAP